MRTFFLDTGYLFGLEAADDQHHAAAVDHWQQLLTAPLSLVTTDHVFGEIVTLLNNRRLHAKAVEVGRRLRENPQIELVPIGPALFDAGWQRFCKRPDKRYSLTDCISFVVMEQRGLREALTFDRHFAQEGFVCLPA